MTLRYTARPISDRTAFTGKHTRSNFDTPFHKVLILLEREIHYLGGKNVVMETDVRENQIRLDGGVYASASPSSPAVRIAFESVHGPLVYATDRFSKWQDNVYAIALALESLRRIDRYGVTTHGEQYTGWKAIESGARAIGAGMTYEDARRVVAGFAEIPWPSHPTFPEYTIGETIRMAKAKAHPDRHNGDRVAWDQLLAAVDVIDAHNK